ncbi:MAG: helix-turn-helix transcriptional regulator [Clostridiales bacterium]|nr:helix-turn-helix transcriptional regulator [Clostridiales bacterium]
MKTLNKIVENFSGNKKELASELEISKPLLYKLLTGDRKLSWNISERFANTFNVDPFDLLIETNGGLSERKLETYLNRNNLKVAGEWPLEEITEVFNELQQQIGTEAAKKFLKVVTGPRSFEVRTEVLQALKELYALRANRREVKNA